MRIDFTKLLGFDTMSNEFSLGFDLQNETLGSKLGAKVGDGVEESAPSTSNIDFQNDSFAGKLGAKISIEIG
jgi:hypothetical protein